MYWMVFLNLVAVGLFAGLALVFTVSLVTIPQLSAEYLMNDNKMSSCGEGAFSIGVWEITASRSLDPKGQRATKAAPSPSSGPAGELAAHQHYRDQRREGWWQI